MSQTEIYTIFCVIVGEDTPFPIKIASSETVAFLQEMIKDKRVNRLGGVDAAQLGLYHIDVSGSAEAREEQLKKLADDIGRREQLDPLHALTNIYSTAPPRETIHILVQPPRIERAGTETDSKSNVPAIVGGTVGGVIGGILILAIIVVIIIRRNQRVDDGGEVIGGILILTIIFVIINGRNGRNRRVDDGVGQKRGLLGEDTEQDDQVLALPMKRTRSPLAVINGSTARRDLTVDALYQKLNRYRLVMVRGTPASGKSTLAQLLEEHIRNQEPGADPILIGSWPCDGSSWSEKLRREGRSDGPSIIIIDEAQLTYWDTKFWNGFLKPSPETLDRVILFASYGSPGSTVSAEGTPMVIPECNRVSLRPVDHADEIAPVGLFLTADEFADMVKKRHPEGFFKEDFLDYVFRATAGHTGAASDLLRIVSADDSFRQVKRDGVKYSLNIFERKFSMHKLWLGLNTGSTFRRGLPTSEALHDPCVARVFRAVLNNNHVTGRMLDSLEDQEALEQCFKSGWLHATTNEKEFQYIFATQLHQWFIDYYLGTNIQACPILMKDHNILNFAIKVIKLFSPRHLSSPRKIGASHKQRPPEAQYQDEFYRCCHRYSNGSLISFPEFGDGKGKANFYIPVRQWGVGLLRDGDRLESHSSQFIGSGAYTKMHFKDYIILDFRKRRPTKGHPGIPNLYHVVFKDEFRQVEIQEGATLETLDKFELLNL